MMIESRAVTRFDKQSLDWLMLASGAGAAVFVIDTADWPVPTGSEQHMLSRVEQARAARFINRLHRDRYVVTHIILPKLLSKAYQQTVTDLSYDRDRFGKPHHISQGQTAPIHFSIAYTGRLSAIAASRSAPVGVDIEYLDPSMVDAQAARLLLGETRFKGWLSLNERQQVEMFYRFWVRQEAVLKAHGTGFHLPHGAAFDLDSGRRAWVVDARAPAAGYDYQDFRTETDVIGCVAAGIPLDAQFIRLMP
jgi:phosphopantetheinyl transferase